MEDSTRELSELIVASVEVGPLINIHYHAGFDRKVVNILPFSGDKFWYEISGSVTELYINPIVPSIGDLDIMFGSTDELAVFDGDSLDGVVTTQFVEDVTIVRIFKNHKYLGYYYLWSDGELTYDWSQGRYQFVSDDSHVWVSHDLVLVGDRSEYHGPAKINTHVKTVFKYCTWATERHSMDDVRSIRCPTWPPDAISFPNRQRIHGWPCKEMISEVVRNGCDLVPVYHPNCKSKYFWRLSFSRAEAMLIRSWTPTQQIVYHMIRLFAKQELFVIRNEEDPEILSNYNIKTLMLWSCESESPDWWNSNCVIDLCAQLIQKLTNWTEKKACLSYFLEDYNLFGFHVHQNPPEYSETLKRLRYYSDREHLTTWFESKYVPQIHIRIKENPSNDSLENADFESGSLSLAEIKAFHSSIAEMELKTSIAVNCIVITRHYFMSRWSKGLYKALIAHNHQSETKRLVDFACVLLRLAWNISDKDEIELTNADILDLLSMIVVRFSNSDQPSSCRSTLSIPIQVSHVYSKWYYMKGKELLCVPCQMNTIAYHIWLKTSKRFFKYALSVQDYYSESIRCLSNAYLTALYCVGEGNHEKASKFFILVKQSAMHGDTAQLEFDDYRSILFINEVAIFCGLYQLLNYFNLSSKSSSRNEISPKFTACVIYCLISGQGSRYTCPFNASHGTKSLSDISEDIRLLPSMFDKFVFIISSRKWRKSAKRNSREDKTAISERKLEDLLVKLSIERFTEFLNLENDLLSNSNFDIGWKISSTFEALHLYKLENYAALLDLCNSVIPAEVLRSNFDENTVLINHTGYRDVSVLCGFQMLFERNVSSLAGLITLVDREALRPENLRDGVNEHRNILFDRVGGEGIVTHMDDYYRVLFQRENNHWNEDDYKKFKEKEEKKLDKKFNRLDLKYSFDTLSPEFLICYLRFQCLLKLNGKKMDLLNALRVMNLVKRGLLFEQLLILFVARKLEMARC